MKALQVSYRDMREGDIEAIALYWWCLVSYFLFLVSCGVVQ
tara:strand:- start:341 stop:463 length:123 start_codon:yes stop_codon:yes gene_type:complete